MTKRQFEQALRQMLQDARKRQKASRVTVKRKNAAQSSLELQGVRYTDVRAHRRRVPKPRIR